MTSRVLSLVASAAGGVESIREQLVEPFVQQGWTVAVTLTPTAADWLTADGESARIAALTGLPVRHAARRPGQTSPHPPPDCIAVVPASANTVAKLALGLADNQALTHVCEAIGQGRLPVVVFPRVNAAHARHPAWSAHLAALRTAQVHLIYGDDVWPLHEPRSAPDRELPWPQIRQVIATAAAGGHPRASACDPP